MKNIPKEITREDVIFKYREFLTVGDLKEFLYKHNFPADAKVVVQRVEDSYYDENNWGAYLKKGEHTIIDENGQFIRGTMEQYTPAFCCVKYTDENDILFINLHY